MMYRKTDWCGEKRSVVDYIPVSRNIIHVPVSPNTSSLIDVVALNISVHSRAIAIRFQVVRHR